MQPTDAIAAVTHRDPYPYYAGLAARPGLFYDEGLRMWIAAGAASVAAVLRNPDCRVRPVAEPVPALLAGGSAGQIFAALVRMNDGQRHAAPKLVLQRALGALDAGVVRGRALALAGSLAAARDMAQPAALSAWTFEAPLQTVGGLLGFAGAQLAQLSEWMREFVACLSPLSSAAQIAGAHAAAHALLESFKILLHSGGAARGSLLAAVIDEAQAAGWEQAGGLLANLVGLLSQSYEATAGLIGNSLIALRGQAGVSGGVAALDTLALVCAVSLRDPPIQNTRRYAARQTEVGGVVVEAGQVILLVLAAASRDDAGGSHPYGFGSGPHACPGQALATTIAAASIDALQGWGAWQGAAAAWRYRPSVNARIPEFIDIAGHRESA